MLRGRYTVYAGMIALVANAALAQDFPTAPPKMDEAEAQGLARVSLRELKAFIPGSIRLKGVTGAEKTKIFHKDGTLDVLDIQNKQGKWRFNKKIGGYCENIPLRMKTTKACYKVFKAPDGMHYFSYQMRTRNFGEVWRPLPKK